MNYSTKSGLKTFNKILLVILILLIVAMLLIVCVFFKGGSVQTVAADVSTADEAAVSEFQSGTFGGVQFDSIEDVVNYYVAAYDATKAETANYIDGDGNTVSFYALVGDEDLQIVGDVLVDGKTNSIIDGIVPGVVKTLFSGNVYGLPPCSNRNPELDVDENEDSLMTSRLTADDILSASVSENADGTVTLVLQPKACEMSHKGLDSQGKMFNVLGAIDETVDSISMLSWASGSTAENCKVTYENGTATVTIDPATGKITEADYEMLVTVDVTHANVSVIKDKSATLQLAYTQHFPASDEYILEKKSLTRA